MKSIVLLSIAYLLSVSDFVTDRPTNVSLNMRKGISLEIKLPEKVNEFSAKYTEVQEDIAESLFLDF